MKNNYLKLPDVDKVGDKTRQGLKWVVSLQFIQKVFFFGCSVILARLLTPADYGLAAMAITLDTITWLVLALGVNSAVMYFQDNIEERLNAAFWLCLASSTFFFIVQMSVAPLIAHIYKEPMLIPIVRVSAIGLFITSMGAIQRTLLSKNLEYKRLSIFDACMNTLNNILYVALAFAGFRVWSFIYPKVIIAVITVITLWNMTKWRPEFKLYFKYWGEMLNYGKNVLFSSIIDYLLGNSTYILIGSLIGATYLGLYSFAYDKSMIVINNITAPIISISFPAFSRLQNHQEKLKNAFFKSVKMISLVSFLFGFVQLALGNEFINVLFGSKWTPAVILFQIIVIYSMLRAIILSGSPLMEATGNPHIVLRWNIIYAPVYIGCIFLGYKLGGLYGIAAATTIVGVIGSLIYLGIIMRVLNWKLSEFYSTIKPALFSSAITGSLLFLMKILLKSMDVSSFFILIILGPAGLLIYFTSIRLLFYDTFEFIVDNSTKFIGPKISGIFIRKQENV